MNEDRKLLIDKIAYLASRNGKEFEEKIKLENQLNKEFDFLRVTGKENEYFKAKRNEFERKAPNELNTLKSENSDLKNNDFKFKIDEAYKGIKGNSLLEVLKILEQNREPIEEKERQKLQCIFKNYSKHEMEQYVKYIENHEDYFDSFDPANDEMILSFFNQLSEFKLFKQGDKFVSKVLKRNFDEPNVIKEIVRLLMNFDDERFLKIINENVMELIVEKIDQQEEKATLLLVRKYLSIQGEGHVSKIFIAEIEKAEDLKFLTLLSIAFQIDSNLGKSLLKIYSERLISDLEIINFESEQVLETALNLINQIICFDKTFYSRIESFFPSILNKTLKHSNEKIQLHSFSIASKISSSFFDKFKVLEFFVALLNKKNVGAIEGFVFLSSQGNLKDKIPIQCLINYCLLDSKIESYYGLSVIFNNFTTFKPRLTSEQEQLIKLKKISKDHLPEDHPEDNDDQVINRIHQFVKAKGIQAIAKILKESKTEKTSESLSQIILNISRIEEYRGLLVQSINAYTRSLLKSANPTTKKNTSHAIARMGISLNPSIAFGTDMAIEIIPPLILLLDDDYELCVFESLLCLTNLSTLSSQVKDKLVQHKIINKIEELFFSDNYMIQTAAMECLCNLMSHAAVRERYNTNHDKFKLVVALSDSDDERCQCAATGALAILFNSHVPVSLADFAVTSTKLVDIIKDHLSPTNPDLCHRCLFIVLGLSEHASTRTFLKELIPALRTDFKNLEMNELAKQAIEQIARK